MYDLIIVGGGPAGAAAAVYAARKQLKTVLIVQEWGGQSNVSADIHNWIGTPSISGADLAKALKGHSEKHVGDYLTIKSPAMATGLFAANDKVSVTTNKGEILEAKALLIASGSSRRKLDVPGAAEYDQKGLTYCASCDGPLFAGQDVAVVGGGNAGFESALQLLAYCKTVYLLNRTEAFRADEITVAAAKAHPNMRIIMNAVPAAVEGAQFVSGLRYKDAHTDEEKKLDVTGIFVEIGLLPNTGWLGETVKLNAIKQVVTDPMTQRTSHPRIWAAGDCTDGLYHQNNIAAGDAVKALEDIYMTLKRS
ncbi:FAD-dependent oxidoreductase [Candidatus Kaiserbacteria bacterium]|nr:FAD-dependent oxidoreductase [Candidatus Kaiserbacteria bacterium]